MKSSQSRYKQWTFTAHGLSNIDIETLHREDLSYSRPLAFIEYGDQLYVTVHPKLLAKAKESKLTAPDTRVDTAWFIEIWPEQRSDWVTWAKAVKAAKWSEPKTKVIVVIPQV